MGLVPERCPKSFQTQAWEMQMGPATGTQSSKFRREAKEMIDEIDRASDHLPLHVFS